MGYLIVARDSLEELKDSSSIEEIYGDNTKVCCQVFDIRVTAMQNLGIFDISEYSSQTLRVILAPYLVSEVEAIEDVIALGC